MSHNLENSFIASMTSIAGGIVHLPRLTTGKTCYATESKGPTLHPYETRVDISSKLCLLHSSKAVPLKFYFQCIEDRYAIFVLTPGIFQHHAINNHEEDYLHASDPNDGEQTLFNLINNKQKIVALKDIGGDTATVFMKATNKRRNLCVRLPSTQGYVFSTGEKGGTALQLNLNILERSVPYEPFLK